MPSTDNITGLILAGGAGRRVGHRDKGLLDWQGRPLIAHVYDCLKPQVGTLLISCNRNLSRYGEFAATVVTDKRRNFQGPLAGIEAATSYIQTEFLVVVGCDMPLLPADLVTRLLAPLCTGTDNLPLISYAHDGERAQYLCAGLKRECLSGISGFLDGGGRAVKEWYGRQRTTVVDFEDQSQCFVNCNTLF
ncbi:MAG: molybdenum cofactor guanylyltransferase MobA [Halioglobus sp.]